MNKNIQDSLKTSMDWRHDMLLALGRVKHKIEDINDPAAKAVALSRYEESYKKIKIMTANIKAVGLEVNSLDSLVDEYINMSQDDEVSTTE